jgi:hypothetical protein
MDHFRIEKIKGEITKVADTRRGEKKGAKRLDSQ